MAITNNRVKKPQAVVINGIDAGGAMQATIQAGYDNIIQSAPDGLQIPMVDKETQYVRGTIVTQDWVHALELLTGVSGTLVFYEAESGAATYCEHTITKPIIHSIALQFNKGGHGTVAFEFECKAAAAEDTIAVMWVQLAAQVAPTAITAARGGYRITAAAHGGASIYHIMSVSFKLTMKLTKACNDGDVGYTCVDAETDGMNGSGAVTFQDAAAALARIVAAKAALVLTVTQSQGATAKTVTIAGVDFTNIDHNASADADFTGVTANYVIANTVGTELTLAGANPILTIA